MKKIVIYFILYIGCLLCVFNQTFADDNLSPTQTLTQSHPAPQKQKKHIDSFKRLTQEFYQLLITPFIIDKLYPDEKINEDITPLLSYLYPNTKKDTLKTISTYMKSFVGLKRRYTYVVNRLEQQIKASKILPEDAPIIAEDGEFAPEYSDETKQTDYDEYQIKYTPYKYVGYAHGELGAPVHRRDKNYQENITNLDEITLAILKFDIPNFVRLMANLPRPSDGSSEKPIELPNGLKARILLANSAPGNLKKIRGALDIYVPQGYYINADYLNPNTRPKFFLSEDKDDNLNISEYQLFLPEANTVVNNNQTQRILTNFVRYPLEFTRTDTTKPMQIKARFSFILCHKNGTCTPEETSHELTLRPSEDEELSLAYNYIAQGFTHLPQEKSKHASLNTATFSPNTQTLTVEFKTTRPFSQVAVMAEDAHNTSFINPHYYISEAKATAIFEIAPNPQHPYNGEPIALTAQFDNSETLRTTITPALTPTNAHPTSSPQTPTSTTSTSPNQTDALSPLKFTPPPSPPSIFKAFFFGVLLNLMPAIFCLFIRLTYLLWTNKDRKKIFLRYALSTALSLLALTFAFSGKYFGTLYTNPILTAAATLIVASYLSEQLGYTDITLFRPFHGKLRLGVLIGIFTIILLTSCPMYLAPEVLSTLFALPFPQNLKYLSFIWLGLITLPLLAFLFPQNRPNFFPYMRALNVIYNIIYIIGLLWLLITLRNETALWLTLSIILIVIFLWHYYPDAINETLRHARAHKRRRELFYIVQKDALKLVIVAFVLAYIAIATAPLKKESSSPTPDEIITSQTYPTLVIITAPWSPISAINSLRLLTLQSKQNINTIEIKSLGNATSANQWLKTYGEITAPMNILFTKRHPNGLMLPQSLDRIDWDEALSTFDTPKKRISIDD